MGGGASANRQGGTPRAGDGAAGNGQSLDSEAKRAMEMIEKMSREQEDLKSLVRSIKGDRGAGPAERKERTIKKVALLTAGGLAPCLSACCGGLIQRYNDLYPEVKIIAYRGGYKGLLLGDSIEVGPDVRQKAGDLFQFGGSPIGNSRVKLTNVKDCLKRGLVKEGQDPQKVAADQLVKDGVDVLHTIGGDDTNLAAADLAAFLKDNNYDLTVIGLPKTIDNDVFPIRQTLGAWTAAEEGAKFFANIVNEQSASFRMLIVHEVMGRDCGYLTAATARNYRETLKSRATVPQLGLHFEKLDVHAVFIPEIPIDIEAEAERLKKVMDNSQVVNIFVSEGAGVESIVKEMEARGEVLPRDAFGHIKLNEVNPGAWFASRFAELVGSERAMVQKSGYFSRAAPANQSDLDLIKSCCALAVDCAVHGEAGVIGHDEDQRNRLRPIEFPRIKGGKPFDINQPWFREMMAEINGPVRLDQPLQTYNPVAYVPRLMNGMTLPKKVAILTAGGLAPCLCSAVAGIIERFNEIAPNVEIICYFNGYRGLLSGNSVRVSSEARRDASALHYHGGSPLGNSRVKLDDIESCLRKGVIKEGEDPYEKGAAQLKADGVDVLYPIGGDTVGAKLAEHLKKQGHQIQVLGLAKTIDNDVTPIKQTLGAWTAAEQGARYFANVVAESSANPRMLIIHEIMGASCGYLTAATADIYRGFLQSKGFVPGIGLTKSRFDVHAVFIPEIPLDIPAEAERLRKVMDQNDCVNIFVSEGAGIEAIAAAMEAKGQTVPRDASGKYKFVEMSVGEWFAKQFSAMIGAEKVLVQKSGYYARSSAANAEDLRLIKSCTDHAVECALRGESGVVGHDEEQYNVLRAIEFDRVKGEKPFKFTQPWFQDLLSKIGQKMEYAPGARVVDVSEEASNNVKVRINVATKRNSSMFR